MPLLALFLASTTVHAEPWQYQDVDLRPANQVSIVVTDEDAAGAAEPSGPDRREPLTDATLDLDTIAACQ